jgi:hypothetical protein
MKANEHSSLVVKNIFDTFWRASDGVHKWYALTQADAIKEFEDTILENPTWYLDALKLSTRDEKFEYLFIDSISPNRGQICRKMEEKGWIETSGTLVPNLGLFLNRSCFKKPIVAKE